MNTAEKWHGTTIVLLRKNGETVVAGDGQVSLGNTVLKSKAKKVRKIPLQVSTMVDYGAHNLPVWLQLTHELPGNKRFLLRRRLCRLRCPSLSLRVL